MAIVRVTRQLDNPEGTSGREPVQYQESDFADDFLGDLKRLETQNRHLQRLNGYLQEIIDGKYERQFARHRRLMWAVVAAVTAVNVAAFGAVLPLVKSNTKAIGALSRAERGPEQASPVDPQIAADAGRRAGRDASRGDRKPALSPPREAKAWPQKGDGESAASTGTPTVETARSVRRATRTPAPSQTESGALSGSIDPSLIEEAVSALEEAADLLEQSIPREP